jgi:hypothetical protein
MSFSIGYEVFGIQNHGSQEIGKGTEKKILKDAGII